MMYDILTNISEKIEWKRKIIMVLERKDPSPGQIVDIWMKRWLAEDRLTLEE